eukprot:gene30176-39374_t
MAFLAGFLCYTFRLFCFDCTICEPKDDWLIETEARNGERGAGMLQKRGKNAAVWSKRYFVITDSKLVYYLAMDRSVMKGELVLAGAMAKESSTRASSRNSGFYFTVSHPQCGVRELCAKTDNRRQQWISKINDVANELERNGSVYGKLLKQGGLKKNVWQERWCVCAGTSLDYFELLSASIREFNLKDKICFEVSAAAAGKKGMKKYVFAFEREGEKVGTPCWRMCPSTRIICPRNRSQS